MRTAREWILEQPGGRDFDEEDLAKAVAAVEARDREIITECARAAENASDFGFRAQVVAAVLGVGATDGQPR